MVDPVADGPVQSLVIVLAVLRTLIVVRDVGTHVPEKTSVVLYCTCQASSLGFLQIGEEGGTHLLEDHDLKVGIIDPFLIDEVVETVCSSKAGWSGANYHKSHFGNSS